MQSEQFKVSPEIFNNLRSSLNATVASPFYHGAFFHALEASHSVCERTGWRPQHLEILSSNDRWILPGYAKYHSYGEYIFDWNIADAVSRAGIQYYPKWVSQFPFSPIEAPLNEPCIDATSMNGLKSALQDYMAPRFLTAQLLYHPSFLTKRLEALGGLTRHNIGFQWQNRGYQSFADFLAGLKAKPAKNIRQERRKVAELKLDILHYHAEKITAEVIQRFYPFYQVTYQKRSGTNGYINLAGFTQWLTALPNQVHIIFAQDAGEDVAAALFLSDNHTLYGRYWGSRVADKLLHFELCYYRGIELCIEHNLTYFNPGVQGEHKVRRGFEPFLTHSSYFYFDPLLREQIAAYFDDETGQLREYQAALEQKLPFRGV